MKRNKKSSNQAHPLHADILVQRLQWRLFTDSTCPYAVLTVAVRPQPGIHEVHRNSTDTHKRETPVTVYRPHCLRAAVAHLVAVGHVQEPGAEGDRRLEEPALPRRQLQASDRVQQ